MTYPEFLKIFDKKISQYFDRYSKYICCKKGCSSCCECGEYQITELELKYLMQGFLSLDDETKKLVQTNFKNMQKGGVCPFLVNKECSVYDFRPIVCRVHGLAYQKDNFVQLPYCANTGLNYSKVYEKGTIKIESINENLDTPEVLKDFDYGEIRSLYNWLNIL